MVSSAPGFGPGVPIEVGKAPHGIRFSDDGKRAYVAVSGDAMIAVVDLARARVIEKYPVGPVPLDLLPLGRDEFAVTHFRASEVSELIRGELTGKTWPVGKSPSLFSPELLGNKSVLACEFGDEVVVFDAKNRDIASRYPTGKQPYPADVTRDGVLAFVPNRADGSVTVIDLLNGKNAATVKVCDKPEGGAVTRDGVHYVVACGGSNELAFINTASFKVVATVKDQVGPRPFSVAMTPDGRYGLVNNAGGETLSILDIAQRCIVGSVQVGKQPIVVRMHPDGKRAMVSNEISGTVQVISVPQALKPRQAGRVNEVLVMGTIHGEHRTSQRFGLKQLEAIIRRIKPDVVLAEISPNRFEAAASEFAVSGTITESRVKSFPEYVDVLFPLQKQMGFAIVPTAGWNLAMHNFRNAALKRLEADPARAEEWKRYQEAEKQSDEAVKKGGAEDDPAWIHSDAYDAALEIGLAAYNRFDADLGTGGWDTINKAHYANIAQWLDQHAFEGKRVLITYGAGHKGWFLRQLRQRKDIRLLEMQQFVATP